MSFLRLGKQLAQSGLHDLNTTAEVNVNNLPGVILDAVIPGYSVISRFINTTLGFDISIVVTCFALLFGTFRATKYIWMYSKGQFDTYCMSAVHIEDGDDLYDNVLEWTAEQSLTKKARAIKARSPRGSAWDEDQDEKNAAISAISDNGIFNYSSWQARVPPRYEPYYGSHYFWYKGRLFYFHRRQRQQTQQQSPWGRYQQEEDLLELSCFGLTTQPVKELLQDIKVSNIRKQLSRTTIRHPASKSSGRWGGHWSRTNSRPSRPMSTVILDEEQKLMIQNDMNEFLHPSSPKWYATRGIPYRRGYLFHGPPGTGKTSLSFALAGIFGLDIHCVALNDPEMTEADLRTLFNSLPRRCIVLLEDIDSAGIKRQDKDDEADDKGRTKEKEKKDGKKKPDADGAKTPDTTAKTNGEVATTDSKPPSEWTLQDLTQAIRLAVAVSSDGKTPSTATTTSTSTSKPDPKRRGGSKKRTDPNSDETNNLGISLSGLLNAIDGVATHEGRILIMTTNHPEKLDAALVRTGRVDIQIQFRLMREKEKAELFRRMYVPDTKGNPTITLKGDKGPTPSVEKEERVDAAWDLDLLATDRAAMVKEVTELAADFADRVPDDTFAPSDVQGFLLLHKKTPRKAVEEVGKWVVTEMEKKKEREEKEKKKEEAKDGNANGSDGEED